MNSARIAAIVACLSLASVGCAHNFDVFEEPVDGGSSDGTNPESSAGQDQFVPGNDGTVTADVANDALSEAAGDSSFNDASGDAPADSPV